MMHGVETCRGRCGVAAHPGMLGDEEKATEEVAGDEERRGRGRRCCRCGRGEQILAARFREAVLDGEEVTVSSSTAQVRSTA